MSHRRGRAVAVALAVVLGFSLLNFLAQLWEPARALSFLGVLHYYRPLEILRGEGWPVQAMLTLTAIGATSWCLGALIFTRRDVLTG
jgi:hypothetical protein